MSYEHEIVCLAQSSKHGGRCVAGKIFAGPQTGEWVRPVCDTPERAVLGCYLSYANGASLETLDLVRIQFTSHDRHQFQSENNIIENGRYWEKIGHLSIDDLECLADDPDTLWELGESSSAGMHDKVSEIYLDGYRQTLYLIEPENVTIRVERSTFNDKLSARSWFNYKNQRYCLKITDPNLRTEYFDLGEGDHAINPRYFVISLGDVWNGYAYKLIANVLG